MFHILKSQKQLLRQQTVSYKKPKRMFMILAVQCKINFHPSLMTINPGYIILFRGAIYLHGVLQGWLVKCRKFCGK